MSASPPIADIAEDDSDVRFLPITDIRRVTQTQIALSDFASPSWSIAALNREGVFASSSLTDAVQAEADTDYFGRRTRQFRSQCPDIAETLQSRNSSDHWGSLHIPHTRDSFGPQRVFR
jgi:hypothetical protein